MKKIFLFMLVVFIFGFCGEVFAEKIVCSPYPATGVQPDTFKVSIDGGTVQNSPPVTVSGGVRLEYNVTSLSNGNHTSTLQACKGTRCSGVTNYPFVLEAPAALAGVTLEP